MEYEYKQQTIPKLNFQQQNDLHEIINKKLLLCPCLDDNCSQQLLSKIIYFFLLLRKGLEILYQWYHLEKNL